MFMVRSKIIKKIKKTIWLLLFVSALFILCLFGILHIPSVQNRILKEVTSIAQDKIGIKLIYSHARLHPLNTLYFEDFLLRDLKTDTLVAGAKVKVTIKGIIPKLTRVSNKDIYVKKIILDKGFIRLYSDLEDGVNISNFIRHLIPVDSTREKKPFSIKEVQIIDSRFGLFFSDTLYKEVFDPSRIDITSLNLRTRNIQIYGDTVKLEIKNMACDERSGFRINNLQAEMYLCRKFMHFSNLKIKTNYSEIESNRFSFLYDDFYMFSKGRFYDNITIETDFKNTYLSLADIGYFTPFFKNNYQNLGINGEINGTISNLNLRDFKIKTGTDSYLEGDFDFTGLPNTDDLFIIANFKPLYLTTNDLIKFNLPKNKEIKLPKALQHLTYFSYKGNFTGLINDFVSFGTIDSDYGRLGTDIILQPDSTGNIAFTGDLRTNNFKLGQFFAKEELINEITSNVRLQGNFIRDGGVNSSIKGYIKKIGLHGYNYQNIEVDGVFSEKSFNGELYIDDPNLVLNFEGLIDFTSDLPEFNFLLDVNHAELDQLKITDKQIPFSASFILDMAGTGIDPTNLNAEVNLLNSLLSKADKQIQIYGLNLSFENDSIENKVELKSDMVDASITGRYLFTKLHNYFMFAANKLIPSLLINDSIVKITDTDTHFDFNINLKNIQPVLSFFSSNLQVANHSFIKGDFVYDSTLNSNIHIESNLLRIYKNRGKYLSGNIFITDSLANADLGCASLLLANRFFLDNYTFESTLYPDSVTFSNRWLNWDTLVQKGAIAGAVSFKPQLPMKPKAHLNLENISFILNDYIWQTNRFNVVIDSSGFITDKISLVQDDQYLIVSGGITSNPNDSMIINIHNLDLDNLNMFSRGESTKLQGLLNGEATITGFSENLTFNTDFFINQFEMNGQVLGDVKLLSSYDNLSEIVDINLVANRGKLQTLVVTGDYYPTNEGKLDLLCNLDKLRLEFAAPFVKKIFATLHGNASGEASITGTLKRPLVNGEIKLQNTKFGIGYLNTKYNFTSDIDVAISNNNILLNNIELYDSLGNSALVNGNVYLKKFSEAYMNLNLQAKNFMCLNTTMANNSSYYGKAFIDGLIRISGSNVSLKINVDALTSKGTVFNVPLNKSGDASRYSYISFINSDSTETGTNDEELIIDETSNNTLELDFNLNVTPDAAIQIVFDPQIGDVIKATGNGELDLRINNTGDFQMVGEYIIEKGDYLFTLQNLINKKFTVQQGSSLRWSGDPVNASIDIDAVYPTRTSLVNLFGTNDENIQSQSRVDVNCELDLTGNLIQPTIGYNISLPDAEPNIQDRVASKLSTEEKLSKQFLSLLVLNQFLLDESIVQSDSVGNSALMAGSTNATEFLSNQLSNWLSQIYDDLDVGINFRPGSQTSSHEVEMSISTQLLNDRISINGSVDMKTNAEAENVNRVVGEFDADYKLTKNGKLRLRAFNRSNDDEITEYSPYTQGVGIFYTEDFDTFGELWSRYLAFFRGDWKKKKKDKSMN